MIYKQGTLLFSGAGDDDEMKQQARDYVAVTGLSFDDVKLAIRGGDVIVEARKDIQWEKDHNF